MVNMNAVVEQSYESMKQDSIEDIVQEIGLKDVQLASLEIKT